MAAFKFCKESGHRFVWSKNGNAFLRKNDQAPKFLVTSKIVFEDYNKKQLLLNSTLTKMPTLCFNTKVMSQMKLSAIS